MVNAPRTLPATMPIGLAGFGGAITEAAIAEDEIRIRLRPERWFSVDYSKPG